MAPPAAPTISWNLHASHRAVAITVNAPWADSVTVRRIVKFNSTDTLWFDPGVEPRYVVPGMVRKTDTSFTGYDLCYPQNVYSVKYVATAYNAAGESTDSDPTSHSAVSPDVVGDVLIGGGTEGWRIPIVVERITPLTYGGRSEKIKVIGRRDLVVIGDRRPYPEFTLTFHTWDFASYQNVEAMLYQFPVNTFSPQYPRWADSATAIHFAADEVTVDTPIMWRSADEGVHEERTWSVRCTQVGAPPTSMVSSLPVGW